MTSIHPIASSPLAPVRILILGGGFAGIRTARELEKLLPPRPGRAEVEIVLISRDNFFLMTPLLFEVCSGTLELSHCSMPVREFLRRARFVEATVEEIDLERRLVRAAAAEGSRYEISYDQLVLALGASTNLELIPGSENAFTFKTLADALVLRNWVIERFERADVETDCERRRRLLTFVIVGGGLVGVELFGELTAFVDEISRFYRRVDRGEVRFVLCEHSERIMPEIPAPLAAYAARLLARRRGASLRTHAPVRSIEPGKVHLDGEVIEADTIVLSAGIAPSSLVAALPLPRDRGGHVVVEPTMRSTERPEVWALGDCAQLPDPEGKPYPYLAQHAMREARVLARNLHAALAGRPLRPFAYRTIGVMASLGHARGLGTVLGVPLRGFFAWWVRRTYYLLVMPRWSRRLRIVIDWTLALFLGPDIVKVDLADEPALLRRGFAAGTASGAGPSRGEGADR